MADSCRIPIKQFPDPVVDTPLAAAPTEKTAVLAGGCFWCVEAVFKELRGVRSVRSGYAGDGAGAANYRDVCSGMTKHAEAIEIVYDASQTTFGQLLKIHFSVAHDPTQKDRQGNDVGRQYRSAIFVSGEEQRRVAEAYIRQLNAAGVFAGPIVTTTTSPSGAASLSRRASSTAYSSYGFRIQVTLDSSMLMPSGLMTILVSVSGTCLTGTTIFTLQTS